MSSSLENRRGPEPTTSMCEVIFDEGSAEPLLEFMPESTARSDRRTSGEALRLDYAAVPGPPPERPAHKRSSFAHSVAAPSPMNAVTMPIGPLADAASPIARPAATASPIGHRPAVASPIQHRSTPPETLSGAARRSSPGRKFDRGRISGRLRGIRARILSAAGLGNSARDLGKRVSLSSTLGGAAVGALAMWLFSVPPAPVVESGQSPAVATDTTLISDAPLPAPGAGTPAAASATPLQAPESVPAISNSRPTAVDAPDGPPAASADVPTAASIPNVPVTTAKAVRTRTAAVPKAVGFRGAVLFRSEPSGAQVFVNGESVGTTPLVLDKLSVGSRAVRLEAPGYPPWTGTVRVVANEQTRVTVNLEP